MGVLLSVLLFPPNANQSYYFQILLASAHDFCVSLGARGTAYITKPENVDTNKYIFRIKLTSDSNKPQMQSVM